jgi:hypothetical protein
VANNILAWRATDGFAAPPPPYTVGSAPGDWQPTPPAFLGPPQTPLFRQFAATWAMLISAAQSWSIWRSCLRPRCRLDITVPIGLSMMSAIPG